MTSLDQRVDVSYLIMQNAALHAIMTPLNKAFKIDVYAGLNKARKLGVGWANHVDT